MRPTELNFVPRIWEMLYQEVQSEVDRRIADGADREAVEAQVMAELRQELLGGRYFFGDDGLRTDLAGAAGLGRGAPRHAPDSTATAPPRPAWSWSTARSGAHR